MGIEQIKPQVNREIKNLLVNNYGVIVTSIVKEFGLSSLEHVQKVAKNSIEEAKKDWSQNGIPDNPELNIWESILENSNRLFCKKINYLQQHGNKIDVTKFHFDYPKTHYATKNQIEFLFSIFDENIDETVRKYLLLNILCGFSYSSLARIFEKNEKHLETQIFNEKKKIMYEEVRLNTPSGKHNNLKLQSVLNIAKEIFDKGYSCNNNEKTLFPELCHSAIKIVGLLANFPATSIPESHALLAWMLFSASRLNAMQDERGSVLTLQEQDRSIWNTKMIEKGLVHLHESANGEEVTIIHLEAGVSAIHSLASDYRSTNWNRIVSLYDNYLAYNNCPSVELEKAIAISKQKGPTEGINAINSIQRKENLDSDDLLYSTLGNLNFQLHKYETAISNFRHAIDLSDESFDRSFYSKKIKICQQRINMSKKYGHSLSF